jgi:hypothetical protein
MENVVGERMVAVARFDGCSESCRSFGLRGKGGAREEEPFGVISLHTTSALLIDLLLPSAWQD